MSEQKYSAIGSRLTRFFYKSGTIGHDSLWVDVPFFKELTHRLLGNRKKMLVKTQLF